MNFNLKIIFVTLAILVASLLLNSFLSIASFEKLYVDSLISTTEIAGTNLKVKIEQALKFGKPLDRFQNMDNLLEKLLEDSEELLSAGILLPDGKILYHTDKGTAGRTGRLPDMTSGDPNQVTTLLIDGNYTTFVPLYDRSRNVAGYVNLTFPRQVVYSKLRTMAATTVNTLWLFIPLTFIGLFALVSLLIARPIRKDLRQINDLLTWTEPGDRGAGSGTDRALPGLSSLNRDLQILETHIREFVSTAAQKMEQLDSIEQACEKLADADRQLNDIEIRVHQAATDVIQGNGRLGQSIEIMIERQKKIRSMLDINNRLMADLLISNKETGL